MVQTVPPFWGERGKGFVGCGWSDWRKCGGWLRRGEGVGGGGEPSVKIKADDF